VALIAQAYLDPPVRKKVNALLAADTSDLTAHDIASEATWADEYRNKNIDNARARTAAWHFVDIEVNGPNIDQACFGHPEPAQQRDRTRTVLSIRFKNSRTNWRTRIPIRKSKSSPSSSCCISLATSISRCMPQMTMTGAVMIRAAGQIFGNLHHYWDDVFVEQLGPNPKSIASGLIGHISEDQVRDWSQGSVSDWAMDSFKIAKDDVYGQLPEPSSKHVYRLSDDYMTTATQDVAIQHSKGGVRLAFILNKALGQNR
jgi:hypothetical protein